jgi:hypothetical protein
MSANMSGYVTVGGRAVAATGLEEGKLRKVAKERAVRLNTYDPTTGIFKEDKQQER